MATPMLRSLREHFGGQAHLIGIMRPYVRDVIEGTSWLDEHIEFDPRSSDRRLGNRSLVRRLRESKLDSALIATNSLRPAVLACAAGVPQRIGYVRYGRGPLLTEKLTPPRKGWQLTPISAVDYYLDLARTMGCDCRSKQLELATTIEDEQQADHVWQRLGLGRHTPVIAMNTGAAYGAAKEWPIDHFAQLAQQLVDQLPVQVLVICGPNERKAALQIANTASRSGVHSLAEETLSIGLSKSVVKRCQLLISNDSGPRHFGAAFDVPTVTLFGPTDPRWSNNFQPQSINLQQSVPCGPCGRRKCPLQHHQCMQQLTVDQVRRAAVRLLLGDRQQAA